MKISDKFGRRLALAASVSLVAIACAPISANSAALSYADEDGVKQEAKKADKKRRVVIKRSRGKDGEDWEARTVLRGALLGGEEQHQALAKINQSLETVRTQLEKARSKGPKSAIEALESAVEGLEAAKSALENHGFSRHAFIGGMPQEREFRFIIKDALEDIDIDKEDLAEMRLELQSELEGAREEIEEARREIEIEVESDEGNREYHIKMLVDAEGEMARMEEHHLKALKQAEEELRRTRERLEKKLAEKKDKAEADKAD